MTILYRYVTREILACLAIVLAVVLSIYLAIDFIEKIDNFMEAGIPAGRCVVLLLYKLPFIIVQIGPLGFLLSILIALGLMSKRNEVIALKSCGIGTSHLLKPTLVLGIVISGLLFVAAEMVVPTFTGNANRIWLQEVRKKNIYATKTNDIWMRSARKIVHIRQFFPDEKQVRGITIHTFDEHFNLVARTDAVSGFFEHGCWHLSEVIQQDFDDGPDGDRIQLLDTLIADFQLLPEDLAQVAKRSDEMGLAELGCHIEKVEREGYPATRFRVDYHAKIAASVVCLLLSLLGAGIALRGKLREGMPVSITYGLAVAFLYWIFNSFCLSLGYAERLSPVVAAWVANVVLACVSGLFLLNAR